MTTKVETKKKATKAKAQVVAKVATEKVSRVGIDAGNRVKEYVENEHLPIPKFSDTKESQDAFGGFAICSHIVANAEKFGVTRETLLDGEGNPILDSKGKKQSVFAFDYSHIYAVILKQTGADLKPLHKANALTQGIYRVSLPAHSMNDKEKTKNMYAKGGIFFARSKSVGLSKNGTIGHLFTLPKYDKAGYYKKNQVDAGTLKAICERFVQRVS